MSERDLPMCFFFEGLHGTFNREDLRAFFDPEFAHVLDRRVRPIRSHRIHLQRVAAVPALGVSRPAQPRKRDAGRCAEDEMPTARRERPGCC